MAAGKLELYPLDFGSDGNKELEFFVRDNLKSLQDALRVLHTSKVDQWRKWYRGIPKEEAKNFPWKDASNVVIQVIGEAVDELKARVLGSIYEVMPLVNALQLGEWKVEDHVEEVRRAIEEFLNYTGLEPTEWDLYRQESIGFTEAIKYGTVGFKVPYEYEMMAVPIGVQNGKTMFQDEIKWQGPRINKLGFTDWGASPSASTIDSARFRYHKRILYKQDLEKRKFEKIYEESEVDKLLKSPDRNGPDEARIKEAQDDKIMLSSLYNGAEWDVYECWFPYWHNGHEYSIVYTYHPGKQVTLRKAFNPYPDNDSPFEMARLGYTDDGLYGYGYCEMLHNYQEEITTGHNQRVDNRTLANAGLIRVDVNSKLDAIFSLYPGALVPAGKDQIENIPLGRNYEGGVDEERLSIELTQKRAGVGEAVTGAGGGVQNPRRGVYSAMGTFAVLQTGNRRVNINISDMRYTHVKLMRKGLKLFAHFGIGDRLKMYGEQGQYLIRGLEAIKSKRMELPIRAATASINKELEKQNSMLLVQVQSRHLMGIAQIMQGIFNQSVPPEMKEYLIGMIRASAAVMTKIYKNFGYDDISQVQPELQFIKELENAKKREQSGGTPANGATAGNPQNASGNASVVQDNSQEQAGYSAMVEPSSMEGIPSLPQ